MGGIFSIDGPVFRICSKIADIWLLNLVFVVTSLPVVTLGASITALHYMSMRMAKGQEGYIVRGYLKSFKQNFKQATILFIILLAAGGLLSVDIYFWMKLGGAVGHIMAAVGTAVGIVYFILCIYTFALQATFDNPIPRTFKNALLIALQRLPVTVLLAVFVITVIYFNTQLLAVNIFMVLYGFGLSAMGTAVFYNLAFSRYMGEEEREEPI